MANIKITDLTAYGDPTSTDVLPIVDVGADVTKKVSIADLIENAGSGTAAAPGIAFDGDSNTGIYRPGDDQLAISTGGTGRLFIDSSGNVGVGSATPAVKCDVVGQVRASTGILFGNDTAAANTLDDYEEGTWTPVHSDGTNTATLSGLYRKVGDLVYLRVSATGTGTLKVGSVSGLPFTNIATIVGVGGTVNTTTAATSNTSFIGYNPVPQKINLNLAGDVSVTVNSSWICSFTAVTF